MSAELGPAVWDLLKLFWILASVAVAFSLGMLGLAPAFVWTLVAGQFLGLQWALVGDAAAAAGVMGWAALNLSGADEALHGAVRPWGRGRRAFVGTAGLLALIGICGASSWGLGLWTLGPASAPACVLWSISITFTCTVGGAGTYFVTERVRRGTGAGRWWSLSVGAAVGVPLALAAIALFIAVVMAGLWVAALIRYLLRYLGLGA